MTDSNIYALISSVEGSIIKPKQKGHRTKKISAPTMRQLINTMQERLSQIKESKMPTEEKTQDTNRKVTQEAIYQETNT